MISHTRHTLCQDQNAKHVTNSDNAFKYNANPHNEEELCIKILTILVELIKESFNISQKNKYYISGALFTLSYTDAEFLMQRGCQIYDIFIPF